MTAASDLDYGYLRQIVFRRSRNVLEPSSDYLFQTRLTGVLRRHGLSSLHDLVARLRLSTSPDLERAVAEAMTINETSFFRDVHVFELLRTTLVPTLIHARRSTQRLRFWSAASSTGQEAYSLALLMRDSFPQLNAWDLRVEGTDISPDVVRRAKQGQFHRIEMNRGLPARMLVRYFDRLGDDWVVKPELAGLCNFRQANLCEPLPFHERFDLILLRNVMIYFSMETRIAVLAAIHRLLAPDGFLILGSAEQPPDKSLWETILTNRTCHFTPRQGTPQSQYAYGTE